MGKELQMACTKRNRRRASPELLDEAGIGVPSSTSSRRNKGKKSTKAITKAKSRKTKDTKAASQVGAKAEVLYGDTTVRPKRGRPKTDNKGRKPNTGAKGEDRTPRRSAQELGIEWIGDFCPDGSPHHLIDIHKFDGGGLFKCSNCKKHVWLPYVLRDAAELDGLIDRYGAQTGYCKYLDKNREVKCLVAKLQDLWYARQNITEWGEFTWLKLARLVTKTMEDKEYDRVK